MQILKTLDINRISKHIHSGVFKYTIIELSVKQEYSDVKLKLRKIQFLDQILKSEFKFWG